MCFLVGNDFIPSLPFLEIDDGGITLLFDSYRQLISTWSGYLVDAEKGKVRMPSLISIFSSIAVNESKKLLELHEQDMEDALYKTDDSETFETADVENSLKSMLGIGASQGATESSGLSSIENNIKSMLNLQPEEEESEDVESAEPSQSDSQQPQPPQGDEASSLLKSLLGIGSSEGKETKETKETKDESTDFIRSLLSSPSTSSPPPTRSTPSPQTIASIQTPLEALSQIPSQAPPSASPSSTSHVLPFDDPTIPPEKRQIIAEMKDKYYRAKLQKSEGEISLELRKDVCKQYIEGLVWTLNYYYHGHLSWMWYFGYHCAPFASGHFPFSSHLRPGVDFV